MSKLMDWYAEERAKDKAAEEEKEQRQQDQIANALYNAQKKIAEWQQGGNSGELKGWAAFAEDYPREMFSADSIRYKPTDATLPRVEIIRPRRGGYGGMNVYGVVDLTKRVEVRTEWQPDLEPMVVTQRIPYGELYMRQIGAAIAKWPETVAEAVSGERKLYAEEKVATELQQIRDKGEWQAQYLEYWQQQALDVTEPCEAEVILAETKPIIERLLRREQVEERRARIDAKVAEMQARLFPEPVTVRRLIIPGSAMRYLVGLQSSDDPCKWQDLGELDENGLPTGAAIYVHGPYVMREETVTPGGRLPWAVDVEIEGETHKFYRAPGKHL